MNDESPFPLQTLYFKTYPLSFLIFRSFYKMVDKQSQIWDLFPCEASSFSSASQGRDKDFS